MREENATTETKTEAARRYQETAASHATRKSHARASDARAAPHGGKRGGRCFEARFCRATAMTRGRGGIRVVDRGGGGCGVGGAGRLVGVRGFAGKVTVDRGCRRMDTVRRGASWAFAVAACTTTLAVLAGCSVDRPTLVDTASENGNGRYGGSVVGSVGGRGDGDGHGDDGTRQRRRDGAATGEAGDAADAGSTDAGSADGRRVTRGTAERTEASLAGASLRQSLGGARFRTARAAQSLRGTKLAEDTLCVD